MSTDYFLYSPSRKRAVMVGSDGLGGVRSWPVEYGGQEFIAWALEEFVRDVVLVDEHHLPDDVENVSRYRPPISSGSQS